jgi:hypothetical protein
MLSAFEDGSEAVTRPLVFQQPQDGRTKVRDRIKKLRASGRI